MVKIEVKTSSFIQWAPSVRRVSALTSSSLIDVEQYKIVKSLQALLFKKYSADSDVWSYGMVLFEIWSVARKPFSTVTNSQVIRLLNKGFCQAPPPGCPRAIYEVMVDCW